MEITNNMTRDDLKQILELHREIYTEEFGYGEPFIQYVEKGLNAFYSVYDPEKDRAWICKENNMVRGFLLLLHHDATTVQLRYFILAPELRGTGIGNTLMKEFRAFMQLKNYSHAFLFTTSELPAAAHLYLKSGFSLTESFPSNRFGKSVVEQRYDLKLK